MLSARLFPAPWAVPNQPPFNLNNTIGAGSTLPILPVGNTFYLHTVQIDVNPGSETSSNCVLQDAVALNIFATLHTQFFSPSVGAFVPTRAPIDFKGIFLTNGLELYNPGAAAIAVYGFITYSFYSNPPS